MIIITAIWGLIKVSTLRSGQILYEGCDLLWADGKPCALGNSAGEKHERMCNKKKEFKHNNNKSLSTTPNSMQEGCGFDWKVDPWPMKVDLKNGMGCGQIWVILVHPGISSNFYIHQAQDWVGTQPCRAVPGQSVRHSAPTYVGQNQAM